MIHLRRDRAGVLRSWVPLADLADTAVPCHVVTTDLRSGQPCWWSGGDPVAVLTASAGLPGVFPPVALGGGLHVDGGVTRPVPVERALDLGAVRTWVVDVSGGSVGRDDGRMTVLEVLLRPFAISRFHLHHESEALRPAQRVVRLPRVDTGPVELTDLSQTARLMQAGYAAGRAAAKAEAVVAVQRPRDGD